MWCIRGFNPLSNQVHIVVMTCLPRAVDRNRTVLETIPVKTSSNWWTGLVRDRDHDTGETRLRLERLVENQSGIRMPHVWRVRPDCWEAERNAVSRLKVSGGLTDTTNLPISDRFTLHEYIPIRNKRKRRVAAVRIEKPSSKEQIRLYHWDPEDGSIRQKFTTGQSWGDLVAKANTQRV